MNDKEQGLELSQQLAQKIINTLIEQHFLKENRIAHKLSDKIATGKMKPEDWKSEFERSIDSINPPEG